MGRTKFLSPIGLFAESSGAMTYGTEWPSFAPATRISLESGAIVTDSGLILCNVWKIFFVRSCGAREGGDLRALAARGVPEAIAGSSRVVFQRSGGGFGNAADGGNASSASHHPRALRLDSIHPWLVQWYRL